MTPSQKDLVFLESVHRWCRLQIAAFGKRRKYQPKRGFSKEEIEQLTLLIALDKAVRAFTDVVPRVE